ncbi:hypothetical protein BC826DRAFT_1023183 [Russula brevipes]|nr:hypothetical protein BC826DRAFT_1023090 [Russula brevipes]KAI0291488.1 hypothetical protein BC826DRAFT_1023183 [Russula brevipes]
MRLSHGHRARSQHAPEKLRESRPERVRRSTEPRQADSVCSAAAHHKAPLPSPVREGSRP